MNHAQKNEYIRMLETVILEADSGAMGGDVSHEFMIPASIGEDVVVNCSACGFQAGGTEERVEGASCPKCKEGKLTAQVAIELGHIFQLGTKYSKAQGAQFLVSPGPRVALRTVAQLQLNTIVLFS